MVEIQPKPTALAGVTLERFLFAGVLLMAAAVRLIGLGAAPLAPIEAANVWPAWLKASGLTAPVLAEPTSPLLYSLHLLVFWLAPGGDGWARVPALLAGVGLVALPWFLRARLGRMTALVLAFLLALDPWLVHYSRLADGVILAFFWAGLAMVALERVRMAAGVRASDTLIDGPAQHETWRWLQIGAVALGLLLVSGVAAWPLLLVIALNVAVLGRPPLDGATLRAQGHAPGMLLVLGGGAALLGSTAWLAQPAAASHMGISLSWWLRSESWGGYASTWFWLRLVADQLLVLVFGAVGLVLLARGASTRRLLIFLLLWLLTATLLLLLPWRNPLLLPVWQMPLLIAAAFAVAHWLGVVPPEVEAREAGLVLLSALALILSTSFWLRTLGIAFDVDLAAVGIVLLLLAATLLILAVYSAWAGWRAARWTGGLLLFAILLTANLSAMWHLAHEVDPMHPDGFFLQEAHPDVRNLAADLATLSALRTGDAGELPVQAQMTATADPLLGWYLRDMRRTQWVLAPDPAQTVRNRRPALVTAPETSIPEATGYMGSVYRIRTTWDPAELTARPVDYAAVQEQTGAFNRLQERAQILWRERGRNVMRWLLYRETAQAPPAESVILWISPAAE